MPFVSRIAPGSLALSLVGFVLAAACAHDKQPETGGYQQGQVQYGQQTYAGASYGAQGYAMGGAGGQYGASPGYGQVTPPAAGSVGGTGGAALPPTSPPAASGGLAQVIDPGAAAMVQPILNQMAKSFTVAGSKPVGSLLVGNFQTGQTLEGQVQLQPQKCYTIVGTALPPVTELNLQLVAVTPLPNLNPVLATDSETGPTAVIGKKPNCYKWPFPLPAAAKVIAQVSAGSGLAALQVYEK
jgi:hypothetical protein